MAEFGELGGFCAESSAHVNTGYRIQLFYRKYSFAGGYTSKSNGKTAYEFGKEFLFDLIGMDSVQCNMDSQGISDGGNGFSMTVYDMVKFGLLYYNGGFWGEQQIISREWVEESTRLQFKRSSGTADYGYQWWVRTFGEEQYDAFFAQGHGGQYIFVIPELELIIAFTSNHTGSSDMYWQFVNDIVAASG